LTAAAGFCSDAARISCIADFAMDDLTARQIFGDVS
jgi:hypothetical protein